MTARWTGTQRPDRKYWAECEECGWTSELHRQLDSEAVRLAAIDSATHNKTVHAELPEGALF